MLDDFSTLVTSLSFMDWVATPLSVVVASGEKLNLKSFPDVRIADFLTKLDLPLASSVDVNLICLEA